MALAINWIATLTAANMATAPTALTDANVVTATELAEVVVLSASMVGGTTPTMTITVYYWDAVATAFHLSGDEFVLDPASSNLAVMNPNGLKLGFVAVVSGAPASAAMNVGTR